MGPARSGTVRVPLRRTLRPGRHVVKVAFAAPRRAPAVRSVALALR